MIARLIRWSASNLVLVLIGALLATAAGHLCAPPRAARRDPRPLRHPGHRLHRVSRPGAAGRRGSGHLSALDRDAVGAEGPRRPRLLVLRRLVRLRDLRGRDRHLLGPLARARIPLRRRPQSARRRHADARAGRDRRRLGLPVRRHGREAHACRAAHDAGLAGALRPRQGGRRGRGRERRRLRAPI